MVRSTLGTGQGASSTWLPRQVHRRGQGHTGSRHAAPGRCGLELAEIRQISRHINDFLVIGRANLTYEYTKFYSLEGAGIMQILIRGEMSMADIRQAIFEKLHELEDDYAVKFSRGATIYVNPTDGKGQNVVPRRHGQSLKKMDCDGPYHSAADDFKL